MENRREEIEEAAEVTATQTMQEYVVEMEENIQEAIERRRIRVQDPIGHEEEVQEVPEFEVEPAPEPRFMPNADINPVIHSQDTIRRRRAFVKAVKKDRVEENRPLSTLQLEKRRARHTRKLIIGQTVEINGHDIMIQKDPQGVQIDHCMRPELNTLKRLEHLTRNESTVNGIHNIFYFDKNFNHVIMDNWHSKKSQYRVLRGVYPRFKGSMVNDQSNASNEYRKKETDQFLVIDKKKFIDSKGDIFAIKRKQGLSYKEILEIKISMRKELRHAERFTKRIKKIVGSIHDEENFDVFYGLVFNKPRPNSFYIFVRFPDVTITNSIEMEHYLGDIFIRLSGYHQARLTFRIETNLHGMRGTFSPLDRVLKWSHSHLAKSNDSQGFSSFCIGGDNHMFSGNHYEQYASTNYAEWSTTPLELESILLSTENFISWESLEGGPYNRMEDIRLYGNKVERLSSIDDTGCDDPFLREQLFKRILTEKNLEKLKPCFKLIKSEDYAKYVVDFNLFFFTVLSMFKEGEIPELCVKYKHRVLLYNPSKNEFYMSTVGDLGSWDSVKNKARQMLPPKRIVYMNGKYHKPTLIKMDETPTDLKGNLSSVDPMFLTRIANTILHQLTTKLIKNEQ